MTIEGRAVFVVSFLLALTVPLSVIPRAAATGTLRGTFVDPGGAALDAHVLIHPDLSGRIDSVAKDFILRANALGTLSVELEAGFYDVCAMSNGFVPMCQKVRIREGQTAKISVRMKVDREVWKAFGSRF